MSLRYLFIFVLLLFSACSTVYIPSAINAPLLTNRSETQVNFALGLGLYPQLAYALTDHIGMMANGSFYNISDDSAHSVQNTVTLATGYYGHIKNYGRYEFYLGTQMGRMNNEYSKFNFFSLFIQPALGYTSNLLDIGFVSPLIQINFKDLNHSYFNKPYSTIFWQPTLLTKIGYKRIRFITELGVAIDLKGKNREKRSEILIFPFIFSIGLNLNIGQSRYVKHTEPRY